MELVKWRVQATRGRKQSAMKTYRG